MPAKIPAEKIEKIIGMYASGLSSTAIAEECGVSASAVCRYARDAGISRDQAAAKHAQYKSKPKPRQGNKEGEIYSASPDGFKSCPMCGGRFPATLEFFYRRTRNGRINLSSGCKACIKAERSSHRDENREAVRSQTRESYAKNKDKYNERKRLLFAESPSLRSAIARKARAWYANNQDKVLAYRRAYQEENREAIRARDKSSRKENPHRHRINSKNRKARMRNAPGSFDMGDVQRIYRLQDGACFWCDCDISSGYDVDHYIALAGGGTNHPSNLVLSCSPCNTSKGAKPPEEFMEYMARIAHIRPVIEKKRVYMREKMREHRARRKRRDATMEA